MAQRFTFILHRYKNHSIREPGRMAALKRSIVGLHSDKSTVVPAKFVDCLVKHFVPNSVSVSVSCAFENNMLILSMPSAAKTTHSFEKQNSLDLSSVTLQHSPDCPFLHLDNEERPLPKEVTQQGIFVGVAVILESSDNKILLTQRADHMRTFPRVWVPPGGHLENDESFTNGAFRELYEETGLNVDIDKCSVKLLSLWESVYPPLLGFGLPRKHHVVAYLHVRSSDTLEQLLQNMKLDPEEVKACMWLNEEQVQSMFEKRSHAHTVKKYEREENGEMKCSDELLSNVFKTTLWRENQIYTGTQLALYKWMNLCKERRHHINKL